MHSEATYNGQRAGMGRITPRPLHPGEGYAVLRCGDTEVVLSYTLLRHLRFHLESSMPYWAEVAAASRALDSITCEASLGRTGDDLS